MKKFHIYLILNVMLLKEMYLLLKFGQIYPYKTGL